ncbi:MAG: efflux RND transporter periplasmic adaptor subunit [Pseudomonadales bacterium]|jgi:RND family efflux transporter MFP subunit|nr:efflux RND transporter periplasmic adaptor subunit [Pseudomonadales bacterium]
MTTSHSARIPLRAHFLSLALLLGASAEAPLVAAQQDGAALDGRASLTVNANTVERGDFTRYVTLSGTVYPWQEVLISAEVGGYRVKEVLVDVGDYVDAGQELVKLSTDLLQAALAASQATLKQNEAAANNAHLKLDRAQQLGSKNLMSAADIDQLNADAQTADGRVAAAKADAESARLRLQYARVVAPDAGVITARSVSVGQIMQAGGEMLRLLRQGRVEWRGQVPESMLPELNAGQRVIVTSADGREHEGRIRVVAPSVDIATRTGLIYVDIDADVALRPGMFARGRIELGKSQAILVPLNALVSSDGYSYVFVLRDDRSVRRQLIQTGAVQGDRIEVIGGLDPGARIVTNGAGFLKDGDLVNLVDAR